MDEANNSMHLRELIRIFERKLTMLKDKQISCCGITMAQCHALVEIGRAVHISLNELAKILNLENSSMSRMVNNLVNKTWVKREIDPQDRRYVTIMLTESGKKLFNDIETSMNTYFREVYNSLPVDKRDQVLDSLQLLLGSIK